MYQAFIVKVNQIKKHSNADRLQVATFFGNDLELKTKMEKTLGGI
jgi:hypothetical protein